MTLAARLAAIKERVTALHLPQTYRLVAVSKGVNAAKMRAAYELGLTHFGESYYQEAALKQPALSDCAITWHFIGRLQSNKCAIIAEQFDWVQSLANWRHATRLNAARAASGKGPLNVCVQVNLAQELQKDGLAPLDVAAFIEALATLAHLRVRGLMLIPKEGESSDFARLATLMHELQQTLALSSEFDTLSMGMSGNYLPALQAGSTMVRIGSLLFLE